VIAEVVLIPLVAMVALLLLWAWRCHPIPPPPSEFEQQLARLQAEFETFAAEVGEQMTPALSAVTEAVRGFADAYPSDLLTEMDHDGG